MPEVHAFPSIPTRILLPIDFSPPASTLDQARHQREDSVRAFHGMVVEKTRDRVSPQSICRTSCAFLGVSNTDQTAALNPSDDGQRLIAVASDPGIDCPHIAQSPRWQRMLFTRVIRSRSSICSQYTANAAHRRDAFVETTRPSNERPATR